MAEVYMASHILCSDWHLTAGVKSGVVAEAMIMYRLYGGTLMMSLALILEQTSSIQVMVPSRMCEFRVAAASLQGPFWALPLAFQIAFKRP